MSPPAPDVVGGGGGGSSGAATEGRCVEASEEGLRSLVTAEAAEIERLRQQLRGDPAEGVASQVASHVGAVEEAISNVERSILAEDRDLGKAQFNPGSVGHPELCPRPCLYFPSGCCVNGQECNFCHFPHPKRPAHLDKRHRAMLRDMPFADCLTIVLPILKERTHALSFGPEVVCQLEALASGLTASTPSSASVSSATSAAAAAAMAAAGTAAAADVAAIGAGVVDVGSVSRAGKEAAALRTALRAMSVRSLLTTLRRAAATPRSPERMGIDAVLEHVRMETSSRMPI